MRYVLVALLLAGCATPQERAEKAIARYAPYCETLGLQKGTEQWGQCIAQQDGQARATAIGIYQGYQAGNPRPR